MMSTRYPEAIDTRLVFRAYASIAGIGVLSALGMAVVVLRSSDPSIPVAASLGLAGTLSLVLAVEAAAFSTIDDPLARLRGLKYFAVTHLLAGGFLGLLTQLFRGAPGRSFADVGAVMPYWLLAPNLFITAAVVLYLAFTASPGPRFTATIRSTTRAGEARERAFAVREKEGHASMRRLRSQYEEQIRQAARQEERARLARDLHDAVKQQLFVIQTAAATVQARVDTDLAGAKDAVEQVRTAAREAMTEMEAMLAQLQAAPLEDVGLVEAVTKQCEALGFRSGATVTVDIRPLPPKQVLPPGAHDTVLRVAQEALSNIGRHARAERVTVRLAPRNRTLVLEVIDDGAGFDPIGTRGGMGIGNMQVRAAEIGGHFELASSPGAGTTVSLSVPFATRSTGTYLMLAGGFAAALLLCGVLLAEGWGLRPIWIGGFWIAFIGTARYLVAAWRVHRSGAAAWA
jgi:signal transduction histidine kinase